MRQRLLTASESIARILGLSAGFVGMVLKESREPSKAFLKAAGFEKVIMYRHRQLGRRPSR